MTFKGHNDLTVLQAEDFNESILFIGTSCK